MRNGAFIALIVPTVVLLSACASGGGYAPPSAPPSASSSPHAAASTPRTAPEQFDPDAPAGQCAITNLAVTVDGSQGAAGSIYSNIVFTNTGPESCALAGVPGVSVVGHGDGTQLGAPVGEIAGPDPVVHLAPGSTAVAVLQSTDISTNGGPLAGTCTVAGGDGYRIYPPHSFSAVFVAAAIPACTNGTVWMQVKAVTAG